MNTESVHWKFQESLLENAILNFEFLFLNNQMKQNSKTESVCFEPIRILPTSTFKLFEDINFQSV